VASEETSGSILVVDVFHSRGHAEPGARVFRELRIARLEENLYPIEGRNEGFGLSKIISV
jgi:hypothetical protein